MAGKTNVNKLIMTAIFVLVVASVLIVWRKPINLGLDLRGGMRLVVEAKDTDDIKVNNDAVLGAVEVIRTRIDSLGVSEPVITRKGERQIVIELPGIDDEARAIAMIGETALLEFKEAEWAPGDLSLLTEKEKREYLGTDGQLDSVKYYDSKGNVIQERFIILRKTVITGNDLKWAGPATNEYGQPIVSLEFSPEGSKKFYAATLRLIGRPLAILLDGKIVSAPNVNEAISGGRAQISGQFTIKDMQDMVIKLKAGSLPVPVEIVENQIIGPTLGAASIAKSKFAAAIGFTLVALFMILYYGLNGVVAIIALLFYAAFDLAVLSSMGAVLTLPGIAGLILTIGMAVDANVIIFERLKEELALGRTIKNAINAAFESAIHTIVDSNLTTILAAFVLFWLGTGSIKGFAITLIVGIVVSMFTAIFITKHLLTNIYEIGFLKRSVEKMKKTEGSI